MFAVQITYNGVTLLSRPGADPLVVVLLSCLSEAVNDQLRFFSDRSVHTAFVALEFVLPSSLHERVQNWCVYSHSNKNCLTKVF